MLNRSVFSFEHPKHLLNSVDPLPTECTQISQRKDITTSTNRDRKLLFDFLSDDLLFEIAKMVAGSKPDESLLELAEAYDNFNPHIKNALRNSFTFSENEPNQERWTFLLRHGIFMVNYSRVFSLTPLLLCMEKTLRMVSITDDVEFFCAIQGNKSLRHLEVAIIGKCDDFRKLVSTIGTLDLEYLEFNIHIKDSSKCPFRLPAPNNICPTALGRLCPKVTEFSVTCAHMHPTHEEPLWQMLPEFPKLRSVSVSGHCPPSSSMERLRKLSEVNLWRVPNIFQVSNAIGSPVISLSTDQALDEEKMDLLLKCLNLDKLCFKFVEETEDAFLKFASLNPVKLICINCHRFRYSNFPSSPEHPKWWVGFEMTQIRNDMFPRLAKVLPNLRSLSLGSVRIPLSAIVDMLSILGGNLELFGHFLFDQDEPPFDRLEKVLHALLKYNPNLKYFSVMDAGLMDNKIIGLQKVLAENYSQLCIQMKRIDIFLERLKRRNPRIAFKYMDQFLKIAHFDRAYETPFELDVFSPPADGVVGPGSA